METRHAYSGANIQCDGTKQTAPLMPPPRIRRLDSPACKNALPDEHKVSTATKTTMSVDLTETVPPWIMAVRAMTAPKKPRARTMEPRRAWKDMLQHEEAGMDPLILAEIMPETRLKHLATKTRFAEYCAENAKPATDQSALDYLRAEAALRNWDHTTMATAAGSLMGAMKRSQTPLGINFSRALKSLDAIAMMQPVRWPAIMTPLEMMTAIDATKDEQAAISMILSATGGQRVGDVLKVQLANVVHHTWVADDAMAYLLTQGKNSKIVPIPIYCRLKCWQQRVKDYLMARRLTGETKLFDDTRQRRAEILRAIRVGNPLAEMRSFRATKILGLGMLGVEMATIALVATHADLKMTNRYMRFGLANAGRMKTVYDATPPQMI